jgi:transposase
MKGAKVYHAIKSLRKAGNSVRDIAKQLKVSKTTVLRYLNIPDNEVEELLTKVRRPSVLEVHREAITQKISSNPKMRLSKLYKIFKRDYEDLQISQRGFFNFSKRIKDSLELPTKRYYKVVSYKPGIQMQVDPGECYIKLSNKERKKIYFCVFKYCYSRMTFVHFQFKPYNTDDFISAHRECFKYYGYIPETMIYDQTKLVVIKEIYREVTYNSKFFQFMNNLSINPYACEGYDPESKGLVERAVREVKEDFLCGEVFSSLSEVRVRAKDWFEEVNNRIHSSLNETPRNMFKEEEKILRPYNISIEELRKVDKTGLISWKRNKYSVPYLYQQKSVYVRENGTSLEILDPNSRKKVASHRLSQEKRRPIISQCHYIDYSQTIEKLKEEIKALFPNKINISILLDSLISNNSKNPREQLLALLKFINNNKHLNWSIIISKVLKLEDIRATKIESIVNEENKQYKLQNIKKDKSNKHNNPKKSLIQRDLSVYDRIMK